MTYVKKWRTHDGLVHWSDVDPYRAPEAPYARTACCRHLLTNGQPARIHEQVSCLECIAEEGRGHE